MNFLEHKMDTSENTLSSLVKRNSLSFKSTQASDEGNKKKEEHKTWTKEKEVFELQLNQLQEQLVAAMVQNQQLMETNKKLQKQDLNDLSKKLEEEKERRRSTEDRLKRILNRKRKGSVNSNISIEHEYDDLSTELGESITSQSHDRENKHATRKKEWKQKILEYKISSWNFIHERISDFINDEDTIQEEVEEEQLSVRRLKENVGRFSDAVQPIKNGYQFLEDLFSWKNPWFTTSVFIIFMYSLWLEVYIPLILMMVIMQLLLNYLRARGIAQRFTNKVRKFSMANKEDSKDGDGASSLSERYQLVLSIAKTVQNTLGLLADNLEKLQNLLLWQHVEASKKLMYTLVFLFVCSCFMSTSSFIATLVMLSAIKMFLITPVYTRFPKVQRRYDDFNRIWQELPTHAENQQQKQMDTETSEEENRTPPRASSPQPNSSSQSEVGTSENVSWGTIIFCDRFQLPRAEAPLPDWNEGRRCTLMDKESPFSSMRHGRLYLTSNYLCFERNQFHSKKNITINLTDVVKVKKSKPISFMPGPGMAIEVDVTNISKPYIFAAMMGRDEAFESIVRAGRALNLDWAD